MIDKPIEKIEFSDLEKLLENSVAESRTIEYKRELPGEKDSDKKEFLADVSAFANTLGGDLLYGISEKGGVPVAIVGVKIADADAVKQKYESMIMAGIEPKIRVDLRTIAVAEGKVALLIRVAKSSLSPHRVIFGGHDKFYARNSSGKYSLDTQQLRDAFNLSQTVAERMKEFRAGRIFEVSAGNTPIELNSGPKAILHFLPLNAFQPGNFIDMQKMAAYKPYHWITSKSSGYFSQITSSPKINFDGVVYHDHQGYNGKDDLHCRYIQIFRNGLVESVASLPCHFEKGGNFFYNISFAESVIHFLYCSLDLAKKLGGAPPAFICLTFVDVKGFRVIGEENPNPHAQKIDRDILQIPEKMIDSYDVQPLEELFPMLDIVWQACGKTGMPDYEKEKIRKIIEHQLSQ